MKSSENPLKTRPLLDQEHRLALVFDDLERQQLTFLDEGAKRIIELITLLMGILVGIAALNRNFPPPFVRDNSLHKVVILISLSSFLGAMFMSFISAQPRRYKRPTHDLTRMRSELDRMIARKIFALRVAGILFFVGSIMLILIIALALYGA